MSTRPSRGEPAASRSPPVSLRAAAIGAAVALAALAANARAAGPVPMADYAPQSIHGFEVLVSPAVLAHPDHAARARAELERQLAAIAATVPAPHLDALRRTRIWVEWDARPEGAAEFHVSADWLRANGYLAEKLAGVEIGNARNFVAWSRQDQPWMLLHELAHARLHASPALQADAAAALEAARAAGLYASVPDVHGRPRTAYALTDAHEYFAELSEAWFGRNDFFPFARAELKAYDPRGARLMQAAWAPAPPTAAPGSAMAMACPPRPRPGTPPPADAPAWQSAFEAALSALDEPDLACDDAPESYRLVLLPATETPTTVRVTLGLAEPVIRASRGGPTLQGRWASGVRSVSRPLRLPEIDRLRRALRQQAFWSAAGDEAGGTAPAADGAYWVLEGRRGDTYQRHVRWQPAEDDPTAVIGALLLELGDPMPPYPLEAPAPAAR